MPQIARQNRRMSLRIAPEDKALLMRAAALQKTNLTDFVMHTAIESARQVVDEAERLQLSKRDSMRVLELLENPPEPNARLLAAAKALPHKL